ncbi:MAG: hypothetical protein AB2556_23435 [Candidatus Thiodiazotropha sp.]
MKQHRTNSSNNDTMDALITSPALRLFDEPAVDLSIQRQQFVALANWGWSLFETVQLQANDWYLEEMQQFAPVVNMIMQLATESDDHVR